MTIKQLGGIFGRNPEFNDIDAESLNVSGTITSNGLTVDSNTLHVDPVNNFVGIRTQFPGEALTVNGNISFAGASRVLYNLGTADTFLQTGTGDVVVLRDNGGTETARFNSAGIGFPSGKGIDFSATSGTGSSELLDDYEEGTFTPTYIGSTTPGSHTYTTQAGFYEKIGRLVNFRIRLTINSKGTIAGNISIGGLPYAAASTASSYGQAFSANGSNLSITAGTSVTGYVNLNNTTVSLLAWSQTTGTTAFTDANMTNTTQLWITGNYLVA